MDVGYGRTHNLYRDKDNEMRKESWHCDMCFKSNEDGQEFPNSVALTAEGGTKFIKRVCINCLTLVEDYILDNCEKNEK